MLAKRARTIASVALGLLLVAAKVWHYWLSFALLGPIVLLLIWMFVQYLTKVVANKYPRQ